MILSPPMILQPKLSSIVKQKYVSVPKIVTSNILQLPTYSHLQRNNYVMKKTSPKLHLNMSCFKIFEDNLFEVVNSFEDISWEIEHLTNVTEA